MGDAGGMRWGNPIRVSRKALRGGGGGVHWEECCRGRENRFENVNTVTILSRVNPVPEKGVTIFFFFATALLGFLFSVSL